MNKLKAMSVVLLGSMVVLIAATMSQSDSLDELQSPKNRSSFNGNVEPGTLEDRRPIPLSTNLESVARITLGDEVEVGDVRKSESLIPLTVRFTTMVGAPIKNVDFQVRASEGNQIKMVNSGATGEVRLGRKVLGGEESISFRHFSHPHLNQNKISFPTDVDLIEVTLPWKSVFVSVMSASGLPVVGCEVTGVYLAALGGGYENQELLLTNALGDAEFMFSDSGTVRITAFCPQLGESSSEQEIDLFGLKTDAFVELSLTPLEKGPTGSLRVAVFSNGPTRSSLPFAVELQLFGGIDQPRRVNSDLASNYLVFRNIPIGQYRLKLSNRYLAPLAPYRISALTEVTVGINEEVESSYSFEVSPVEVVNLETNGIQTNPVTLEWLLPDGNSNGVGEIFEYRNGGGYTTLSELERPGHYYLYRDPRELAVLKVGEEGDDESGRLFAFPDEANRLEHRVVFESGR
ncbi:MAG: hypothetical protein JKY61_12980 [Planctomycetes bacterium]|nr:hypothetical protein [Planctomycetota bacterium]